ncbi:unnamed protein product [Bursaphelenchus okinawaensis]|uniref:Uncharacterized protein n=1 Tax=Bursaphelenchus okinawaensis TaxID=465554 RepID=A0A811LM53_9BILA|nr:unnamed protein product [Bursaphelenchus okinawaensis]CAG9123970.1 unnamed protein product [Bursaphelenchus okinawaensis]
MAVQQIQRLFFIVAVLIISLVNVSAQGILGADPTASGTVLLAHGGELPPMSVYNSQPAAPYYNYGFFG